ncbi:MAG: alpha/beta hydrolase [Candidatus Woesearchaeota archaeon]
MNKIFIIHGSYGSPEENWFPWLKTELEELGCKVFIPKFPTPNNQSLSSWMKVFKPCEMLIDENSILVGHSLGPAFILHLLERHKVKSAFFISGFVGKLNHPDFDLINDTFVNHHFDWQKIRSNCSTFQIYHSDNDPYVPLDRAEEIARFLEIKVKIIKNAGHFNKAAGYTTFPLLLEEIKKKL